MSLKMHPVPGKLKAVTLCAAFMEGAKASMSPHEWSDTRGNIFYGVKAGNEHVWHKALDQAQNHGVPFYSIDNAYLDPTRGTHFRVTRNGLQHTGMGDTDGARFAALDMRIAPWRDWALGGYVLAVEQSEDHMVRTVGEPRWLMDNLKAMADKGLTKVRWRRWSGDKLTLQATLAEDLAGAQAVVTHTSAAAIMATLAGVPVRCSPKCAAFMMTGQPEAQRRRWAGVLCDNQFTIEELKDGTAWRKLNPGSA